MQSVYLTSALTWVGALMLVFSAMHDVAVRTVPHVFVFGLLICGAILQLSAGHFFQYALPVTVVVFLVTFVFWRFGFMGGGDMKLLTAASMFVYPQVLVFLLATALCGGVLSVLFLLGGFVAPRPARQRPQKFVARIWRAELWRLRRRGPLPYAVAIAAGGICTVYSVLVR